MAEKKVLQFKRPIKRFSRFEGPIGFLKGIFGLWFLGEYQRRMKVEYDDIPSLDVLSYNTNKGVVQGSNVPSVVLANEILRQEGLRTASQADLENALRNKSIDLNGFYVDTSLILRSRSEPNSYLAGNLMKQIQSRNGHQGPPFMIPLNGLELRIDFDSLPCLLAYNLTKKSEIIYAPILDKTGVFYLEEVDEKNGIPKIVHEKQEISPGSETTEVRDREQDAYIEHLSGLKADSSGHSTNMGNSGLSGVTFGAGKTIFPHKNALDYSNSNGRIVVVKDRRSR